MKIYLALTPQYQENAERSAKIIGDHWRVLGFVLPTFWLIYYRLWLPLTAWVALSLSIFNIAQHSGIFCLYFYCIGALLDRP